MRSKTGFCCTAVAIAFVGITALETPYARAQTSITTPHESANAGLHEFFRRTTRRLAGADLAEVQTRDDWERMRPRLREQLLEMLGLAPLPERTNLHAEVTGTVEHDEFVVELLHFQSRPGLYVTANFYRPKHVERPLPTILYLCGHGNVKVDGISYGSKANYQHHPAWFAREGYCALVLDTLQLGEIEGLHHGTHREGMWWWHARGYTPAGVEAWNALRALDYLETRPEVDMKRIGVTGRSGGGAYTWWLAAIDDRPACLVPVAGITDLENHVIDGCIEGHCDCMFMVNTYAWDFATLAALAAPRPLLLSNTDKDRIFPLDGVVRTHAKIKRIYELLGAAEKLGLLITEGPHKDTQELQVPAFRWMNRWLQNRDTPITRVADKPFDPKRLKVFHEIPEDQKNTTIHDTFVRGFEPPAAPGSRSAWDSLREQWISELNALTFRNWPKSPPELQVQLAKEQTAHELRLQRFTFATEENLQLTMDVLASPRHSRYSKVVLKLVDQHGWDEWAAGAAQSFPNMFDLVRSSEVNAEFAEAAKVVSDHDWAIALLPSRGNGPDVWLPANAEPRKLVHIQRRFALLGRTADDGRIWDACRAIDTLSEIAPFRESQLVLSAKARSAGLAVYAAVFRPKVARVELYHPTTTHRDGPYLLNVLRILDLPQAAAMILPRSVVFHGTDQSAWQWTEAVGSLYEPAGLVEFRTAATK